MAYYRHDRQDPGLLVNDTGTGNTIACDSPQAIELILDALRHFVLNAGVDGFRFDLATVLGRDGEAFDPQAPLLRAIAGDPVLCDRVLIAEPWDIGQGGYQLGNFAPPFLEWNDHFRDDVRRFWRGDRRMIGQLATRLAGSSDFFRKDGQQTTRSVNFIAAHDGLTLADLDQLRAQAQRGQWRAEPRRPQREPVVEQRRRGRERRCGDRRSAPARPPRHAGDAVCLARHASCSPPATNSAAPSTATTTPMRRTMRSPGSTGKRATCELEAHVQALAAFRADWRARVKADVRFLDGKQLPPGGLLDVEWLSESGHPLDEHEWQQPDRHRLTMLLAAPDGAGRIAIVVNGDRRAAVFSVPARAGFGWVPAAATERDVKRQLDHGALLIAGRSVVYLREQRSAGADRETAA